MFAFYIFLAHEFLLKQNIYKYFKAEAFHWTPALSKLVFMFHVGG